jgi:hypothetical protein
VARVESALLIGAAQILWLDVPYHAAVDPRSSSRAPAARRHGLAACSAHHFRDGAQKGVKRRPAHAQMDGAALDTPDWLRPGGRAAMAHKPHTIAAHGREPARFHRQRTLAVLGGQARGRVRNRRSVRAVVHSGVAAAEYSEGHSGWDAAARRRRDCWAGSRTQRRPPLRRARRQTGSLSPRGRMWRWTARRAGSSGCGRTLPALIWRRRGRGVCWMAAGRRLHLCWMRLRDRYRSPTPDIP